MGFDSQITFIVCCPRSGSTWLRLLLNSHPQIICENETFIFTASAGIANLFKAHNLELGFKGLRRYVTREELVKFTSTYIENIFTCKLKKKQKLFIVEKSVEHAFYISLIREIFPDSKFIHLVRDGRDVAISITEASKTWQVDFPQDITEAFDMWNIHNTEIERQLFLVKKQNKFFLKFEDLYCNTKAELNLIYDFIGASKLLDSDVEEIVSENEFSILKEKYISWGNGNFFRKGKPNQWKHQFSKFENKQALSVIGDMLKRYDYEMGSVN
jgi:LPS sulfotransferase NodH